MPRYLEKGKCKGRVCKVWLNATTERGARALGGGVVSGGRWPIAVDEFLYLVKKRELETRQ